MAIFRNLKAFPNPKVYKHLKKFRTKEKKRKIDFGQSYAFLLYH